MDTHTVTHMHSLSLSLSQPIFRNKEHQNRPSFVEIYTYLKLPAAKLLHWSQRDSSVSVKARRLGAKLEEATQLYMDLQDNYDIVH